MVLTDEQWADLQALCDERLSGCTVGVRCYPDIGVRVVVYLADAHPRMALRIGASYLEAKRWLEERYGDLAGA